MKMSQTKFEFIFARPTDLKGEIFHTIIHNYDESSVRPSKSPKFTSTGCKILVIHVPSFETSSSSFV
jgi:hypothetical protein